MNTASQLASHVVHFGIFPIIILFCVVVMAQNMRQALNYFLETFEETDETD